MILKTTLFFTKPFFLFMKQHHPYTLLFYQIFSLTQIIKIIHFLLHYRTHNWFHQLRTVSPLSNPYLLSAFHPLNLFLNLRPMNLLCLIHPLIFLHNHFDILHVSSILLHDIKITCCHLTPISPILAKVLSQVHDNHYIILFLIPTYLLPTALFQLTFLHIESLHHMIRLFFLPHQKEAMEVELSALTENNTYALFSFE